MGAGVFGKYLYLPLNFSVNLKLLKISSSKNHIFRFKNSEAEVFSRANKNSENSFPDLPYKKG